MTQRRQPPPDLFMIKKGFVITEDEAIDLRIRRRIVNRMSKRMFIPPRQLTEDEFVEQCKTVVREILLEVNFVLNFYQITMTKSTRGGAQTFSAVITSPENGCIQQNHTHLTLQFQSLNRLRKSGSQTANCR